MPAIQKINARISFLVLNDYSSERGNEKTAPRLSAVPSPVKR